MSDNDSAENSDVSLSENRELVNMNKKIKHKIPKGL